MKLNETYALALPLLFQTVWIQINVKTFADTKGLVVYASATKEQQKAAKRIHSTGSIQILKMTLKWLEKTNLSTGT